MNISILFFFLFISSIELRRHNTEDDIYELDDLLKKTYNLQRHHPSKQYNDQDEDEQQEEEEEDEQYVPSYKKKNPSRKKVLVEQEESDNDDPDNQLLPEITHQDHASNPSTCVQKYQIRPEQLVKVKELKNGAHMIRYILLDKRTLSSQFNLKEHCMLNCCSEKTCDLAMLSEQATHEGYKCYLFACNGNCTLASHQDYTIMIPKKDSALYTQLLTTKIEEKSTSTLANHNISSKKAFFRETSVIIFLIFGLISTIVLFIYLFRHCRDSQKRGRRLKNYAVDADYLINGLYL